MEWMKGLFSKIADLYASKFAFRLIVWVVGISTVLLLTTITVQALVIRKYKRTIYQLRAATIQLKAQRDIATESLVQEKARATLHSLKKDEANYSQKRSDLAKEIKQSKERQRVEDAKLKAKLKVIDDLSIKELLKNSKELEEAITQAQKKPPAKEVVKKQ